MLTHPSLLVVNEIGYLLISRTGALLFFQLVRRRYETVSTVQTSNKGREEWGAVFGDEVMAAALIDRLLHHCHVVAIRGNSYRLRHQQALWQSTETRRAGRSTQTRAPHAFDACPFGVLPRPRLAVS